jgi:HSP20 family protein
MAKQRTETERESRSATRSEGRQGERSRASALARRDALMSANPFSVLRRLTEELFGAPALTRGLTAGGWTPSAAALEWTPQVDVFQRGNEFVVRLDLPGMEADDAEIDITEDAITISGERQDEREEEREGVWRAERIYGRFERVIPLPEGALPETARATFNNGVLEIVVEAPPREAARGRRLEISQQNRNQSDRNQQGRAQQSGQQQSSQERKER